MENVNIKFMKALAFTLNNSAFSFSAEWDTDHIVVDHRGFVIAIVELDKDHENIVVESYEGKIKKFPYLSHRCSNEELVDEISTVLYSLCW